MEEKGCDIREVCRRLAVTSRTLRYYEEKGIVQSTRDPFTGRRQYGPAQIERIRNVRLLRAIGLSVKSIQALQRQDTDLDGAIRMRLAEVYALLDAKTKEIQLLREALVALESGGDPLSLVSAAPDMTKEPDAHLEKIARICAESIVFDRIAILYTHLGQALIQVMPPEDFARIRAETLKPLGKFAAFGPITRDPRCGHILYSHVKYEKLGLKIKFVFRDGQINGLWLGYSEVQGKELR